MIRHGLWTMRIFSEWCRRNLQLFCKPPNKRFDRLLQLCERYAGVAKQRELNGKANTIGVPPPACHEVLIGPR